MFDNTSNEGEVISSVKKLVSKYPIFYFPIIVTLFTIIPTCLFLSYEIIHNLGLEFSKILIVLLAGMTIFFVIAIVFAVTNSITLEIFEQIEKGKKPSLRKALSDTFNLNVIKMIPLIFGWSLLWFFLFPIDFLLGIIGYHYLKSYRMMVYLTIPGIAWKNLSLKSASKDAFEVVKKNELDFSILTGLTLSIYATSVPLIIQTLLQRPDVYMFFPSWAWMAILGYALFVFCMISFVEQLIAADLYLWYLKWKKVCANSRETNFIEWSMWSVEKPSVLDGIPEFIRRK